MDYPLGARNVTRNQHLLRVLIPILMDYPLGDDDFISYP